MNCNYLYVFFLSCSLLVPKSLSAAGDDNKKKKTIVHELHKSTKRNSNDIVIDIKPITKRDLNSELQQLNIDDKKFNKFCLELRKTCGSSAEINAEFQDKAFLFLKKIVELNLLSGSPGTTQLTRGAFDVEAQEKTSSAFVLNPLKMSDSEFYQFCASQNSQTQLTRNGLGGAVELQSLMGPILSSLTAQREINEKVEGVQGAQKSWKPTMRSGANVLILGTVMVLLTLFEKYFNITTTTG